MQFPFVLAVLASAAAPAAQKLDEVLPMPPALSAPTLDSELLKDTSLCVFPFVKETTAGSSDKKYLESIQKAFFDVAKDSPLLKDTVLLGEDTSRCDLHDAACFSAVGKRSGCENVLVGSSAAKGNGFVLSVRIFEVAKERVLPGSEVEQVLETDRQSDVQAWAEGQACRALQVKCLGRLELDADRKDMTVYVDNRVAPRSFKAPESIAVEPGVHGVRVAVGQRTSLEKKVAVRRDGASEPIYARQTEKGGIPLWLASDLHGARPDASVDVQEGGWKKPVGYSMAAAGLLAAGIGAYEGLHGKSLMNGANDRFRAQSGYFQSDLATLDSAKSAASTANILFAVGGVLMAAGLTTVFVF